MAHIFICSIDVYERYALVLLLRVETKRKNDRRSTICLMEREITINNNDSNNNKTKNARTNANF